MSPQLRGEGGSWLLASLQAAEASATTYLHPRGCPGKTGQHEGSDVCISHPEATVHQVSYSQRELFQTPRSARVTSFLEAFMASEVLE